MNPFHDDTLSLPIFRLFNNCLSRKPQKQARKSLIVKCQMWMLFHVLRAVVVVVDDDVVGSQQSRRLRLRARRAGRKQFWWLFLLQFDKSLIDWRPSSIYYITMFVRRNKWINFIFWSSLLSHILRRFHLARQTEREKQFRWEMNKNYMHDMMM